MSACHGMIKETIMDLEILGVGIIILLTDIDELIKSLELKLTPFLVEVLEAETAA